LALLIWTRPNLLLLDEPTNHLDLEMRHALTMALQSYEGGVILVSHDRALLRASCDQFILVAAQQAQVFDGDLDDYSAWLNTQRLQENQAQKEAVLQNNASTNKQDRAQSKVERQARIVARRPLIKEVEQIEARMAKLQTNKAACDERLNEPALYSATDKTELQQLLKQQAEYATQLEDDEMRWLELQEQLEALPAFD